MVFEKFEEIIAFAIEREKEAALFYRDLQAQVKNESSKQTVKIFEEMELGHIIMLQTFKKDDAVKFSPEKLNDLKISDYMTYIEAKSEMTFQEVMIMAMKREENSMKLYQLLAEEAEDESAKNLFLRLSEEEAKHKFQLESIYDSEILKEN